MATEKNISSRIIHKHDIEANWNKATNFIPKAGEIIIYDKDETYDYERFKIGDGETKVIDLKFVNQQSDWNQTDSSAPDFVKNRTHWEEEVVVSTYDSSTSTMTLTQYDESRSYTVEFNGIVYDNLHFEKAIHNAGGNLYHVYLGEIVTKLSDETAKYPFSIYAYSSSGYPDISQDIELSVSVNEGINIDSVTIYDAEKIVHHLDPKYIKDMYYTGAPVEVCIFNTTVEYPDLFPFPSSALIAINEGTEYKVVFNDVEYSCVAYSDGHGTICIGNQQIPIGQIGWEFSEIIESNEPFFMCRTEEHDECMYMFSETGNHSILIYENKPEIHKIDTKYLPTLVGENTTGKEYEIQIGTGTEVMVASKGAEIFNDYINNIASSNYSHAEGTQTIASGVASHAEGSSTIASGSSSHAEGNGTKASGTYSHAEGQKTIASGSRSHAEGYTTTASSNYSHAEGYNTKVTNDSTITATATTTIINKGTAGHAEGYGSVAYGVISHAEGNGTYASGAQSHAEGNSTTASGDSSHAEGHGTVASGSYSHAEGFLSTASGDQSHAEGSSTTASGNYSHAEGVITKASGHYSHAEGQGTTASNLYSHAEGQLTTASGRDSHAEGYSTTASGQDSHAEGQLTTASGNCSHAEGYRTRAVGRSQHVQGEYNLFDTTNNPDDKGTYAHIVGNGNENSRSNAHTLDWNGNAWFSGDVYVGSTSGRNKDAGSKKLATEEYVNSRQSDWNASEGEAGYIKNKPEKEVAWNDVKDKPFYEVPTGGDTLKWSIDLESLDESDVVGEMFVKISDIVIEQSDLVNGYTFFVAGDGEYEYTADEIEIITDGVISLAEGALTIVSDAAVGVDIFGIVFPECGVYIILELSNGKIRIPGYTGFPMATTIEDKFIPDTIVRKNDVMLYVSEGSKNPISSGAVYNELDFYMTKRNPQGNGSLSLNRKQDTKIGQNSVAIGDRNTASGLASFAMGHSATASGAYSNSIGYYTTASGYASHAEGGETIASGNYSHAEGQCTAAYGYRSHAEGGGPGGTIKVTGDAGATVYSFQKESVGELHSSEVIRNGKNFAKIISVDIANSTITLDKTLSDDALSNAEVDLIILVASGQYSHAEGSNTIASGSYSHAEGIRTTAAGESSHAEGLRTTALGRYSHAEGFRTTALSDYSHAEGQQIIAASKNQHVQGKYNIEDTEGKYAHIVGNGNIEDYSNAHTLDWDGNAWFAGDVYVGSTSGTNKDEGSKKLVTQEYVDIRVPAWTEADEGKVLKIVNGVPTWTNINVTSIDDGDGNVVIS